MLTYRKLNSQLCGDGGRQRFEFPMNKESNANSSHSEHFFDTAKQKLDCSGLYFESCKNASLRFRKKKFIYL